LAVIKDLNPFNNSSASKGASGESSGVNQLSFDDAKKAFGYGIISAITSTTHTTVYVSL